ncbi:MAG: hypothetical protein AAGB22_09910 [Bacteroidota bacterium]
MKKHGILGLFLIGIATTTFGQAFEKGKFLLSGGIGLGIFGTTSEWKITDNFTLRNEDGAFGINIPIAAEYAISNRISLGIVLQPVTYIDDPDDTADANDENVPGFTFGITGAYHFITTEKLDFFGNMVLGAGTLNFPENDNNDEFAFSGAHLKLGVGLRKYFSNRVGWFCTLGYAYYGFQLSEFIADGTELDTDEIDWDFTFNGLELATGITVKL